METTRVPAGAVVVGVDGSRSSNRAVIWGADQAHLTGHALVLAHAVKPMTAGAWVGPGDYNLAEMLGAVDESARAELDAALAVARRAHSGLGVQTLLEHRDPRDVLLGLSQTASMVVVGSRGRGPMKSLLLGSVSVAVSQHSRCPVVVLRDTEGEPDAARTGVVVGTDGTPRSFAAMQFAFEQAALRGTALTVLHGYFTEQDVGLPSTAKSYEKADTEDMDLLIAESIAGLETDHPEVKVLIHAERGLPETVLVHAAEGAELVVVGTHPANALYALIAGEVSRFVLGHAHCAVAVVPDPA